LADKTDSSFFDQDAHARTADAHPALRDAAARTAAAACRAAKETVSSQHRLQVAWARTDEELREAQRLR